MEVSGCVSIQGTHPSKAAFEGRLRHSDASRLSHFKCSFKFRRQMQPSFPGFEGSTGWILHSPTYPKIHCALDCYYITAPYLSSAVRFDSQLSGLLGDRSGASSGKVKGVNGLLRKTGNQGRRSAQATQATAQVAYAAVHRHAVRLQRNDRLYLAWIDLF